MLEKILVKEVIAPIIIIAVAIIFSWISKRIIKRLFKVKIVGIDTKRQKSLMEFFKNLVNVFIYIIAIIMILDVYGVDSKSILASLGVFTAVLALSLQDILRDLIAGVSMILEGNIRMGDTVTITGFQGEVVAMGLKSLRIRSFNGEIKIFSNRNIIEVINHTLGNSLAIIDITIPHDSDLELVEEVLNKLCEKISTEIPELKENLRLEGIINTTPIGMVLRISGITTPMKQFKVQRRVLREVIVTLHEKGVVVK